VTACACRVTLTFFSVNRDECSNRLEEKESDRASQRKSEHARERKREREKEKEKERQREGGREREYRKNIEGKIV